MNTNDDLSKQEDDMGSADNADNFKGICNVSFLQYFMTTCI